VAGRLVQFLRFSSSPCSLFHIAVVPGKDDYGVIAPVLAPIRAFIMKLKYDDNGKFTFNHPGSETPVTVRVRFTFAGDLVAGREILGLKSPFSAPFEICNWCRASKKEIHLPPPTIRLDDGRLIYDCPFPLRDVKRMCHLAHCFRYNEPEFTCPACKVTFTRATHDGQIRDYPKKAREQHAKNHEGQGWLRRPLLDTAGLICVMHARKNITSLLYKQCIGTNITTDKISKSLFIYMTQEIKIQIPKSHTQKTKKSEKEGWIRAPTLQGDEDDKMFTHFMSI